MEGERLVAQSEVLGTAAARIHAIRDAHGSAGTLVNGPVHGSVAIHGVQHGVGPADRRERPVAVDLGLVEAQGRAHAENEDDDQDLPEHCALPTRPRRRLL
jgi:hypothetical protein